jgi:hypothetical protein
MPHRTLKDSKKQQGWPLVELKPTSGYFLDAPVCDAELDTVET